MDRGRNSGLRVVALGVVAGIAALALGTPASAESKYLKLVKVSRFVNPVIVSGKTNGNCRNVVQTKNLKQGHVDLVFKDLARNCNNLFAVSYSYSIPPAILQTGRKYRLSYKIERLQHRGPNQMNVGASVAAGCRHPTKKLANNVVVSNGSPRERKASGLRSWNGCTGNDLFVISFSVGNCAGQGRCVRFDYFYRTMKGKPPPLK